MVQHSPVHKDVLLKSSLPSSFNPVQTDASWYPYMQSDSDYDTTSVVTMNKVSFDKIVSKLS